MPILEKQKHFREIQKLPFCYLCGKKFQPHDNKDRDHIPSQSCFAKSDKNFPLWLPTHKETCNHPHHEDDEKIGQVVSLKHGRIPSNPKNRKLEFNSFNGASDNILRAVVNIHIPGAIWRWIRGFHSALYHEYLPSDTPHAMETPFPEAKQTPQGPEFTALPEPQHRNLVKLIKGFRATNTVDRISCNNQKLLYECSWTQADNGTWICVFALNLYDWKYLGDIKNFPARGCVGRYHFKDGTHPQSATLGRSPTILLPNYDPLDPFAK